MKICRQCIESVTQYITIDYYCIRLHSYVSIYSHRITVTSGLVTQWLLTSWVNPPWKTAGNAGKTGGHSNWCIYPTIGKKLFWYNGGVMWGVKLRCWSLVPTKHIFHTTLHCSTTIWACSNLTCEWPNH